jgi:Tfp pilus assembly protein PilV
MMLKDKLEGWTIIETLVSMVIVSVIIVLVSNVQSFLIKDNHLFMKANATTLIDSYHQVSLQEEEWMDWEVDTMLMNFSCSVEEINENLIKVEYIATDSYKSEVIHKVYVEKQ